jgi:hypothetical protein
MGAGAATCDREQDWQYGRTQKRTRHDHVIASKHNRSGRAAGRLYQTISCRRGTQRTRSVRKAIRFHQGLGGQLIKKGTATANDNAASDKVVCRSRLGGMLNYYYREAA